MQELMNLRIKLMQDTAFLLDEDGLLFEKDSAYVLLRGKAASRWISRLGPYLNGEYTLDELCSGFNQAQREMIVKLVHTLLQKGILKHVSPEMPGILDEAVHRHFRSQIEFIDHYADTPLARFKAFRESQVLLLGSGEALAALGCLLLRNGLKDLVLHPIDEADECMYQLVQEVEQLRSAGCDASVSRSEDASLQKPGSLSTYDIVVYCSESGSLQDILKWNQRCLDEQARFLPAYIFADQAFIGPLVEPTRGPCWLCAQMRLSSNSMSDVSAALWKIIALGNTPGTRRTGGFSLIARMIGNGLGFELFKVLSGTLSPDTEGDVVIQNCETLESTSEKLIRHPLCPACSHNSLEASLDQLRDIVAGNRNTNVAQEDTLAKGIDLIAPHFGIFQAFQDDDIEQFPLRHTKLHVGPPISPLVGASDVVAYGIKHMQEAHYRAVREAMKHYPKELPDVRGMVDASIAELEEQGKAALPAHVFSTWCGSRVLEKEQRTWWMPAYSLLTRSVRYVPAAVVYPQSPLNNPRMFEQTIGSCLGTTFREMYMDGLLSALAYEHMCELARNRSTVVEIDGEGLQCNDADVHFLLQSARHLECPFTLLKVVHHSPLSMICIYASNTPLRSVGYGFSEVEAMKLALLQFVGDLQSKQSDINLPGLRAGALPELSLLSQNLSQTSQVSSLEEIPTTLEEIENYLRQQKYDMLFADTTTSDIYDTALHMSGTVLLARRSAFQEEGA